MQIPRRLTHEQWARGYRPITDMLTLHFGTAFEMWHTGGGCMAIQATLDGGMEVMVTDYIDTLSSPQKRLDAEMEGLSLGYSVGLYSPADDYCETKGWAQHADARTGQDVVDLVILALDDWDRHRRANGDKGEDCECGYVRNEAERRGLNTFPHEYDPMRHILRERVQKVRKW